MIKTPETDRLWRSAPFCAHVTSGALDASGSQR